MLARVLAGPFCLAGCILTAAAADAEPARLSGETIKSTLTGAIFELDTPLGTKVPVRFSSNGLMAGEAGALAGLLGAERDRGRWWVADDRLCMKWFRWFDAEANCFDLRQKGETIYWEQPDGRSGTATIAGRFEEQQARPVLASAAAPARNPEPSGDVSRFASSVPIQHPATSESISPAVEEQPKAEAPPPEVHRSPPVPVKLPEPARARPAQSKQPKVATASPPAKARPAQQRPATRPAARPAQPPEPELPTFRVARVQAGDVLNVREGPSEYHSPVGALSPDGRGIRIVGSCRGLWCPIRHGRVSGWVNAYYLAAEQPGPAASAGSR